MDLNTATQEGLISLLLYDEQNAHLVDGLVDTKWYDLFYKSIAESAKKYLRRYGKPAKEMAYDLIQEIKEREPDAEETYDQLYRSLDANKGGVNAEYIINNATRFVRVQNLKRTLMDCVKIGQNNPDDDALATVEAKFSDWLKQSNKGQLEVMDFSDVGQSLAWLDKEEDESFPTGIPELDYHGHGPARKRLHTLLAPFGTGKSWWLLHLAKQSLKLGRKVLYVSLEMSADEVAQRAYQMFFSVSKIGNTVKRTYFDRDADGNFAGLDQRQIERPAFTDPGIGKKLRKEMKKHNFKLMIQEYPTGQMTMSIFEALLERLESQHNFIPDLILVDYADLFKTDANNLRQSIGKIYIDLRGVAVQRNIAVATVSQVNRAGITQKLITHASAAEDVSKAGTADTILTYNQTLAEQRNGTARIFVSKGRGGQDKFQVVISQSYAMGQYALDAIPLGTDYWQEVEDYGENHTNDGDD